MIAYIDGKLAYKDPTYVIVETNGIGYQIRISLHTYGFLKDGERCKLLTYFHVKEDAQILFGFFEQEEKKLFMDLISVSGIGPNTALTILSYMAPAELLDAIVSENIRLIQNIKGIGSKTAQRLVLELKDKVKKQNLISESSIQSLKTHNTLRSEALSALVTLGIQKNAAEKTIDVILKDQEHISLENLIKLALKTT